MKKPVALLFRDWGPYHWARAEALAARGALVMGAFQGHSRGLAYEAQKGPQGRRAEILGTKAGLIGWLERVSPRAVLVPGWHEPLALAALGYCCGKKIPAILMCESTEKDQARSPWREAVKAGLLGNFDAALIAGRYTRDYLKKLGFVAPLIQGYAAVDNAHFAGGRPPKKGKAPYFLMVARLIPVKGHAVAIEAFGRALSGGLPKGFELLMAGDGPLRPELERLATAAGLKGRIRFLGAVTYQDLPGLYAGAAASILPSSSEPWGLVLNESLAAGTPVIASEACGSVELVRQGVNGYRFEPGDSRALAGSMLAIAGSAKKRTAWKRDCQAAVGPFGPDSFAKGAMAALTAAEAHCRRPKPTLGSLILRAFVWAAR